MIYDIVTGDEMWINAYEYEEYFEKEWSNYK